MRPKIIDYYIAKFADADADGRVRVHRRFAAQVLESNEKVVIAAKIPYPDPPHDLIEFRETVKLRSFVLQLIDTSRRVSSGAFYAGSFDALIKSAQARLLTRTGDLRRDRAGFRIADLDERRLARIQIAINRDLQFFERTLDPTFTLWPIYLITKLRILRCINADARDCLWDFDRASPDRTFFVVNEEQLIKLLKDEYVRLCLPYMKSDDAINSVGHRARHYFDLLKKEYPGIVEILVDYVNSSYNMTGAKTGVSREFARCLVRNVVKSIGEPPKSVGKSFPQKRAEAIKNRLRRTSDPLLKGVISRTTSFS